MALSVGVTFGIATQLLMDGDPAVRTPGIIAPYRKNICDVIRGLLEQEGVKMVERKA
jgi:saccharopine dehydrogenase (NADP+, L-glutamate forming)